MNQIVNAVAYSALLLFAHAVSGQFLSLGTTGLTPANINSGNLPVFKTTRVEFTDGGSCQYLDAGPLTIPLTTGLTITMSFQFSGSTPSNWEALFDLNMGTTANTNAIELARYGTGSRLKFSIYQSTNDALNIIENSAVNTFAQNNVAQISIRFDPSNSDPFYSSTGMVYYHRVTNGQIGTPGIFQPTYQLTSRSLTNAYIGRSRRSTGTCLNGAIYSLKMYQRVLTDTEVLWDTAKFFSDSEALDGASTVVTSPLIAFSGTTFAGTYDNTANVPQFNSLSTIFTGGSFLSFPNQALNYATNGFSFLITFKFTGTAGNNERLFEFGSTANSNNIVISRSGTSTKLNFQYYVGSSVGGTLRTLTDFSQNVVYRLTFVYNPNVGSAGLMSLWSNGTLIEHAFGQTAPQDYQSSYLYIGKSNFASVGALNAEIYSLKIYNRALHLGEMATDGGIVTSTTSTTTTSSTTTTTSTTSTTSTTTSTTSTTTTTTTTSTPTPTQTPSIMDLTGQLIKLDSTGLTPANINTGNLPVFKATRVEFTGGTSCQYLDAGPLSIPLTTGLTITMSFQFSGSTPSNWEALFDLNMGTTANTNAIELARYGTGSRLKFSIYQSTNDALNIIDNSAVNTFAQNNVAQISIRFDPSNSDPFYSSTGMVYYHRVTNGQIGTPGIFQPTYQLTSRSLTNAYIGRSRRSTGTCLNGAIYSLKMYQRVLTDTEVLWDTAKFFSDSEALDGASTVVTSPLIAFTGTTFAGTYDNTANVPQFNSLSTIFTGGSFLSFPNQALNYATNGFSFLITFKFTGTAGNNERLFEFGSTANSNNIIISRSGTSTKLNFQYYVGSSVGGTLRTLTDFSQNVVYRLTFVYNPNVGSAGLMSLWSNGTLIEHAFGQTVPQDYQSSYLYIGKSNFASVGALNAEIYSLKIYNRALHLGEMATDGGIVTSTTSTTTTSSTTTTTTTTSTTSTTSTTTSTTSTTTTTTTTSTPTPTQTPSIMDLTGQLIKLDSTGLTPANINTGNLPVFKATRVEFTGGTSCQYLDAGPLSIPLTTGLTITMSFQFSGSTPSNWEALFDLNMGTTANTNAIELARYGTGSRLKFSIYQSTNDALNIIDNSAVNTFAQNNVAQISIRFDPSNSDPFYSSTGMVYYHRVTNGQIGTPAIFQPTYQLTSRSLTNAYIGRSRRSMGTCLNGTIYSFKMYQRVLTDTEVLWDTAKFFSDSAALDGASTVVTSPLIAFSGLTFAGTYDNTANVPQFNSLSTIFTGGSFLRFPNQALNYATNGFSVSIIFKFTGTAGNNERLIEFGSTANSNNIIISRSGTSTKLNFQYYVGSSVGGTLRTLTDFSQNVVYRLTFVYNPNVGSAGLMSLWSNGTLIEHAFGQTVPQDYQSSYLYIGKSNFASVGALNAEIYSLKIYNRAILLGEIVENAIVPATSVTTTIRPTLNTQSDSSDLDASRIVLVVGIVGVAFVIIASIVGVVYARRKHSRRNKKTIDIPSQMNFATSPGLYSPTTMPTQNAWVTGYSDVGLTTNQEQTMTSSTYTQNPTYMTSPVLESTNMNFGFAQPTYSPLAAGGTMPIAYTPMTYGATPYESNGYGQGQNNN